MSPHERVLDGLGRRIEALSRGPSAISAPFTRLFRPFLHRMGWRPRTKIRAARALMAGLEQVRFDAKARAHTPKLLAATIRELEANLSQVERSTVIHRRPSVAFMAWLRRCHALVVVANRALVDVEDRCAPILAAMRDEALLLPPLTMHDAPDDEEDESGSDDDDAGLEPRADPTRVLELRLDTIDHLLAAAREEDALLGRRRRLLDAARGILLETSATLSLDPHGVQSRLRIIAQQITLINRYEAAGLKSDVALMHQARTALSRGERDRLFAVLCALRQRAVDTGDVDVTTLSTSAIELLAGRPATAEDEQASLHRSGIEVLGERVVRAIDEGYERGRNRKAEDDEGIDGFAATLVKSYFGPGKERSTLAHALAADGCFEVGGVLSPVRIQEEYIRHRIVAFPTPWLELVPAAGPEDLGSAVIVDPRSIIMDLAAGRLLTRRYVQEEVATRNKTVMQGEIRVYVLDGSTSMLGSRARMRDALLVAELATLIERLENPRKHARVVLYYRYFDEALGVLRRVDNAGAALEAIREVMGTPRTGGTDIEGALLASMQLVREAKQDDPELARAQIVLVTDGEASVSERKIIAARSAIGELSVGVSVIALGEENEGLREIVAHQRAKQERAFYHFMPDEHLDRMSEGRIDASIAIHLPHESRTAAADRALEARLHPVLEALAELQRTRESAALRDLDRVDRERRIERVEIEAVGEGERAGLEALYRDDRALRRRYERWFPPAVGPAPGLERVVPAEGMPERDDLDSVVVLLATIAEVVATVGSTHRARQAEAVDLLERLLPNARLSAARYHELTRSFPSAVASALRAVHEATGAVSAPQTAAPGRDQARA